MLFNLLNLWGHMAQMLNAEDLDPSFYSVFRNILTDWLMRSTNTNLQRFTETVRLELEGLSKSVALSTGMSMPLIWEVARPTLPSTAEQWTAYDKLIGISKMLDNTAAVSYGKYCSKPTNRQDNVNAIVTTKDVILKSLTELLSSSTGIHYPIQVAHSKRCSHR